MALPTTIRGFPSASKHPPQPLVHNYKQTPSKKAAKGQIRPWAFQNPTRTPSEGANLMPQTPLPNEPIRARRSGQKKSDGVRSNDVTQGLDGWDMPFSFFPQRRVKESPVQFYECWKEDFHRKMGLAPEWLRIGIPSLFIRMYPVAMGRAFWSPIDCRSSL